ncbi:hypothetical protein VSR69_33035 [Paraburkholderia phytofirmans]|uniref:hypothetical protein n=1 Tax=Paraburkholderia sp. BL9I2N2 TaxID=1938809 RepID=UPI001052D5A2|nr:hypothetical protein [Paraburkholderia sp. BL9I2N2]TCK96014.1 hypothetical protein B0G74_2657 [Paraburkholderia sp. BL9I2N2]
MKSVNWKILFAIGFGAGMLLTALLKFPPNSSSDWATWVQAIGSIGAVGIAIWVSHKQYRDSQLLEGQRRGAEIAREETEIRAFIQATHDELRAIWSDYNEHVGPALRKTRDDQPFLYLFPASEDAFTIYNGSASYQIGKVPDVELRRLIVSVYSRFKRLILSLQINNRMVQERIDLDIFEHSSNRSLVLKDKDAHMSRHTNALKKRDSDLLTEIDSFFSAANEWLAE